MPTFGENSGNGLHLTLGIFGAQAPG